MKCSECEERVTCLINGSVLALAWQEGYEFDQQELYQEELKRMDQRRWIHDLEKMREWKK